MSAWRLLAAGVALAVAVATAFAVLTVSTSKGMGFTIIDVMVAPIAIVFYLGPSLLAMGMASRSRSVAAIAVALLVALLLAGGLEAFRATPWHAGYLRARAADAETTLLFGVLLAFWPLTAIGGLLWLALNRRAGPPGP